MEGGRRNARQKRPAVQFVASGSLSGAGEPGFRARQRRRFSEGLLAVILTGAFQGPAKLRLWLAPNQPIAAVAIREPLWRRFGAQPLCEARQIDDDALMRAGADLFARVPRA